MIPQKHFTLCESVEDALKEYKPGSTVMVGGFGLSGIPENIIEYASTADHIKDLTVISTEAGDDSWELGRLIEKNKITKQYACYIGRCNVMEKAYLEGTIELELIPQGTFAEKISNSAKGIPAFYCKAGMNTLYAEGKIDMTVLGALETSATGDIANYMIPGKMAKGMSRAMDLVSSPAAMKALVVQSHMENHGQPKIKEKCDLPLTGKGCVHTIIMELACFDVSEGGLVLRDYNPETSVEEIRGKTGPKFEVGRNCKP